MLDIQKILSKRLQEKRLVKISSTQLINELINNHLKINCNIIYKNNIIYVKNLPANKKFELYLKKRELLDKIQKKLSKYGIKLFVKDIRILI